jgi:hypothetical protein
MGMLMHMTQMKLAEEQETKPEPKSQEEVKKPRTKKKAN